MPLLISVLLCVVFSLSIVCGLAFLSRLHFCLFSMNFLFNISCIYVFFGGFDLIREDGLLYTKNVYILYRDVCKPVHLQLLMLNFTLSRCSPISLYLLLRFSLFISTKSCLLMGYTFMHTQTRSEWTGIAHCWLYIRTTFMLSSLSLKHSLSINLYFIFFLLC